MKTKDIRPLIPPCGLPVLARRIGLSTSRLGHKLGDESISVGDFKDLLAEVGQDEKEWMRSPLEALSLLGPSPWRAEHRPVIIRNLVAVASSLPVQEVPLATPSEVVLDCESATRAAVRELAGDPALALGAVYDLDKYRLQDPERALTLTRTLATQVAPRLPHGQTQVFAEAAGVMATALRNTGQLSSAAEALRIALIAAQKSKIPMTRARLLRRLAVVFGDRLECDHGLVCLDLAASHYLETGDLVRLTRTIAERGIVLTDASRCAEAKVFLEHALKALEADDNQYRGAVHHCLSITATASDCRQEAESHLVQAEKFFEGSQDLRLAPSILQRGYLALATGDPDLAIEMYLAARGMFKSNPITQAFVTVELINALGKVGRLDDVRQEAKRIIFILEPFSASTQVAMVVGKIADIITEEIAPGSLEKLLGAVRLLREARINAEPPVPGQGPSRKDLR
jgi:tetratricopeptide (TPR) repeat protein